MKKQKINDHEWYGNQMESRTIDVDIEHKRTLKFAKE